MPNYFTNNCYRKNYPINRARGTYFNGKTYVVYQGPDLDPRIMAFDHASSSWSDDYQVGENVMENDTDDHGNPGMCIDGNGRIHVVYGGHGTHDGEMRHRVSVNPEDITSWQNGGSLPNPIVVLSTYPALFKLENDDLILICRGRNETGKPPSQSNGGATPHKADWVYTVSTNNGNSWSSPVSFLDGTELENPDVSWYAYSHAQGNEIHVVFCYHECADPNQHQPIRNNTYYIKRSANGSWVNVEGSTLSIPVTKSDADNPAKKIKVRDFSGNTLFPYVDVDSDGKPFISFGEVESSGVRKYCANWTGSSWNVKSVAFHTDNSGDDTVSRFYTRAAIFRRNDNVWSLFCFGANGQDLLEYKTTNRNNSWTFEKTIWSGVFDDPCIIWHPHNDAYLFFDDGANGIRHGYLYGDSGLVGNNETTIHECENLSVSANEDTPTVNDSNASNGKFVKLESNQSGDWIEFTLNASAGNYDVVLRGKKTQRRGKFQLSINGINQGSIIDQYASTSSFQEWNLASKTFSPGNYIFRFQCVGKSASSADFTGSFDCIGLKSGSPIPEPTIYECENLSVSASDNTPTVNDSNASNNKFVKLESNRSGDWIKFTVNVRAGTYDIVLRGKKTKNRGKFQLSINGINQGSIIDQYASTSSFQEWNLASKTFSSSGNYTFRFQCVGKSASSGNFTGSFDYIKLD